MVSQTLTTKQILSLLGRNQNLCEISSEYPSLEHPLPSRHLCTCIKVSTKSELTTIQKLLNQTTHEYDEKNSNKHSKNSREQIEIIELFPYKQDDEMNNKLYKKSRYQLTKRNDSDSEENIDNTN